jgi:hypothetical protein
MSLILEQSHRPTPRTEHKNKQDLKSAHLTHMLLELCCNPGLEMHGKCLVLDAEIPCSMLRST